MIQFSKWLNITDENQIDPLLQEDLHKQGKPQFYHHYGTRYGDDHTSKLTGVAVFNTNVFHMKHPDLRKISDTTTITQVTQSLGRCYHSTNTNNYHAFGSLQSVLDLIPVASTNRCR